MNKATDNEILSGDDQDSSQIGESIANRNSFTFMDSGTYKMMESTDELYFLSLIDENKNILCSRCNTPEFKYTRVSIWDNITRQLSKKLGRALLSEKVQRRWNNIQQRMKTNFSKQLTRFTDLYGQIDPESITLESLSLSKNDKYVLEILGFDTIKHALCFPNSSANSLRNSNPVLEARLQEQTSSCSSSGAVPVIKLEDSPTIICADSYQSTSSNSKTNDLESQQSSALIYSRSQIPASYTDSQRLSQQSNHHHLPTNHNHNPEESPSLIDVFPMSQMRDNDSTYPVRGGISSIMNDKRRSNQFHFNNNHQPTSAGQLLNSSRDICTFEELDVMRKKLEFKKLQLEVDNLELEKERRKMEIEVLRRQLQNDNYAAIPPSKRFRNN